MTRVFNQCFTATPRAVNSAIALTAIVLFNWAPTASADPPGDRTLHASPEEVLQVLKQAAADGDQEALKKLFGPGVERNASGDPAQGAAWSDKNFGSLDQD